MIREDLPQVAVDALTWHHEPAYASEPGPAEQARLDWPSSLSRRERAAWVRCCARTVGHCWHMTRDGSVMAPEWVCCCCPADREGIPTHDCARCHPERGPGRSLLAVIRGWLGG